MKPPLNAKMPDPPRQCAMVLKALGDETPLRILESLLIGEKCVTDLVQGLRCSQSHASHRLLWVAISGDGIDDDRSCALKQAVF